MTEKNLFNYLKKNHKYGSDYFYNLKFPINQRIYFYGDHFKNRKGFPRLFFFGRILKLLGNIFLCYFYKRDDKKVKILSSIYYDDKSSLNKIGFSSFRTISSPKKLYPTAWDFKLLYHTIRLQWHENFSSLNFLLSNKFFNYIKNYQDCFEQFVKKNKFELLLVPNDTNLFERLHISVFKKLNRPSILFNHGGMPSLYDGILENQTDYIFTWGKKQRDAYVAMGYDKNKFFISGHPFYKVVPKTLKFDLNNVLVLTKSLNGVSPIEETRLEDRGNAIMYLVMIQDVLKKFGVTNINLRPHPSEEKNWYKKHIDINFFNFDRLPLNDSLKKASLVIGPVSTTFIDSLAHEVNYVVFEPTIDGENIFGYPISPPLDGSDPLIPMAKTTDELLDIIKAKKKVDISVYTQFAPINYDFSSLISIAQKNK